MIEREALIHRANMRDAIATVHNDPREQALRVEREHGLNRHVQRVEAVLLEHDFEEFLAIAERVQWRFGQQQFAVLKQGKSVEDRD